MMSRRTSAVVAAGLAVCLLLAGGMSYFASGSPDGLNKVASDQGFDRTGSEHQLADTPLSGYEAESVDQGWLAGGLAGVIGVGLTFLLAAGMVIVLRRRRPDAAAAGRASGVEDGSR